MLKCQKIIKNSVEEDVFRAKISRNIAEYIKQSIIEYSFMLGKEKLCINHYNDVMFCLNLILKKEVEHGNSTTS